MKLSKTQKRYIRNNYRQMSVARMASRLKMQPGDVERALSQLGLGSPGDQGRPGRESGGAVGSDALARFGARLTFLNRYAVAFTIVVSLALILRSIHLLDVVDTPPFQQLHNDAFTYDRWAHRIMEGDWLGKSRPVFYLGPLYPYLLAVIYSAIYPSPFTACVIQILLSVLSAGLVYHLGKQILGTGTGVVAGLLTACYGTLIFYSCLILSATLIIFLDLLMLVLLVSGLKKPATWKWLAAGVCFGLSACARGSVILFGPLAVIAVVAYFGFRCWKKWLPATACLTVAFFLTISPVTLHNWVIGKDLVLLTSNAGTNLFIGNNAYSKGIYMNSPRYKGRAMGLSIRDQQANFPEVAKQELGRSDLKTSEISSFWMSKTLEEIRSDIGRWLGLEGNKLKYLANAYEVPNNYNYYFSKQFSGVLRFPLVTYGAIFPLAVAGLIISGWRWREHGVLYAFVLAHGAALLTFFVTARYRLVIVPVLSVYAAATLVWVCQWIVTRRPWRLVLLLVLLIPGYALAFQKVTRSSDYASYINLANAYRDLGQPEEALRNYDRAISLSPGYHYTYLKKGEVLARLGRRDEAREVLNRALTLARRNNDSLNTRRIQQALRRLDTD